MNLKTCILTFFLLAMHFSSQLGSLLFAENGHFPLLSGVSENKLALSQPCIDYLKRSFSYNGAQATSLSDFKAN